MCQALGDGTVHTHSILGGIEKLEPIILEDLNLVRREKTCVCVCVYVCVEFYYLYCQDQRLTIPSLKISSSNIIGFYSFFSFKKKKKKKKKKKY